MHKKKKKKLIVKKNNNKGLVSSHTEWEIHPHPFF